jgi:glucose/arabinose dehydrogenase/cytochrome c2
MATFRVVSRFLPLGLLACAVLASKPRWSPRASYEPNPGEALFLRRCALCHPTDEHSAQGPGLGGVLGRKAAAARGFGYSRALRDSGLTWDRATLDRFLASPSQVVPGTAMPLAVPDAAERRDLLDFLSSLLAGGLATPSAQASPGDYRGDAPGVRRRISVAQLPPPYATPSARNGPNVVDPPPGARPAAPAGFTVEVVAKDLKNPRLIRFAPNGDLFVAESGAGQVLILRAEPGVATPQRTEVFAAGLDRPFGIAFFPPGPDPHWVYVANVNSIVRFPYKNGDLRARGSPQTVVSALTQGSGGHSTRDIAFSNDGARMFVSVGSASNVGEQMPARFADEISEWEALHGLGAAWDEEQNRADVLVFDPDGSSGRVFATGIRNCVGLAVNPATGDLWCSTNERDGLGDDLVPDYLTRVREGAFYGWPWFYLGDHEDPRLANERTDLAGKVTVPDVLLQAHSAPLEMTFYYGSMFPAPYRGNAFACLHGSWNRGSRTGPKVIRILFDKGIPTGEYEDFVTGFVLNDANVWARPVGVAVARDGSLWLSEDGNGTIWRVSVTASTPAQARP